MCIRDRTNIVYNASSASNGTFTENEPNSLTGNNDAVKMVKNSPSGNSQSHLNYQISGNGSTTSFVASVFVQKTNHSRYFLQLLSTNVSDNFYVYYNVDDGTTSATDFGSPSNNITSTRTIESYRDNWYRLIVRVEGFAQNTFNGYRVGLGHPTSGSQSYQDTTDELIAYGAQIEVGNFVTSYIPTYGAAATRGYEATTLEGTEFSDVFGTEFKEFSLVADYDNTQTDDGTNYAIVDLWGEASNYDDRIEWFKDNASPYHIETRSFGQGNPTFANGELSASSKAKSQRFATSWYVPDYSNTSSRRFVVSMGGEAVDVINDSSGTTVPQITRMGIGCNPTRLDFKPGLLHFKRLMVYNKTLSDGQLQNLSAQ